MFTVSGFATEVQIIECVKKLQVHLRVLFYKKNIIILVCILWK